MAFCTLCSLEVIGDILETILPVLEVQFALETISAVFGGTICPVGEETFFPAK